MTRNQVAERIREKLYEQRVPVQKFEKTAGLSQNAVHNILSGRSQDPHLSTIIAISNAFGCTVDDLLGISGEEKKNHQETREIRFSNRTLLGEVLGYLKDNLVTGRIECSSLQVLEALQEIYLFSEVNNKGTFDDRFAKWWLEHAKLN